MIQADLAALRARFFTAFPADDRQVTWMGKPTVNPDESKPYCRLVIEPGAADIVEKGILKTYLTIGVITLTITVPKGTGLAAGYDIRDKFVTLFRDWRSSDGALSMGEINDGAITEDDTSIKLRVRIRWESFRRTS